MSTQDIPWSFDTFVSNSKTRAVVAAAVEVADHSAVAPNPLLLCGPTGSGKSHLLHAIARRARSRKVLRMSADEFGHLLLHAIRCDDIDAFRCRLATFDIVLFDDFPISDGKTETQKAISAHLQQARATGTRVVVAFHTSSIELQRTRRRLRYLFDSPVFATLTYPDVAGRRVLVRRAAADRSVSLGSSVIEDLARRLGTPREIQAAVARLAIET